MELYEKPFLGKSVKTYSLMICDDDPIFADLLRHKVEACMRLRGRICQTAVYADGKQFLEHLETSMPEIIFLDIDMPGISGIDLVDEMIKQDMQTNVIFVTNRDDLVFQAIHYQPFRFIRKEKLDDELEEAVFHLLDKLEREDRVFQAQTKNGIRLFRLKDIMYLESCKHYLNVHFCSECCEIRGKISNLEKWMAGYDFIKIHRSYLVNMRFIKAVRSKEVELDNGELLPNQQRSFTGCEEAAHALSEETCICRLLVRLRRFWRVP